jgi:hypothetical protein
MPWGDRGNRDYGGRGCVHCRELDPKPQCSLLNEAAKVRGECSVRFFCGSCFERPVQILPVAWLLEGRSNLAKAEMVKAFRTGYEKLLYEEGVKVRRAKVFIQQKLDALLEHLAGLLAASQPSLKRCVLL